VQGRLATSSSDQVIHARQGITLALPELGMKAVRTSPEGAQLSEPSLDQISMIDCHAEVIYLHIVLICEPQEYPSEV